MSTNNLLERVTDFINENKLIQKGDKIVLGLSGGADSVFLFYVLKSINVNFVCAHINHNFRGEESKRDMEFVDALCKKQAVQCFVLDIDVNAYCKKLGVGSEQGARQVRYDFFNTVLEKSGANKIATAHNSTDNAETMIFNLVRGAGVKGISGISAARKNIIRPILCATKEEIENYLKANGIDYVTDSTNNTDLYTRNKIRHNILPQVKQINPNYANTMLQSAALLKEQADFIEENTLLAFSQLEYNQSTGINSEKIKSFSPLIAKNTLIKILEIHRINYDKKLIDSFYSFICEKKTGKRFSLCENTFANVCYDYVIINTESKYESVQLNIADKKAVFADKQIVLQPIEKFKFENVKNFEKIYLCDYDKIGKAVVIRSYNTSDRVAFAHRSGTKTLAKLFSDDKIPLVKRASLAVVTTLDNKIIFIENYGVTKDFVTSEKTKNAISIKIK